jgi:hypothetical protein
MSKETNAHWRRHDYRSKSLFMIIEGLNKSILELKKNQDLNNWYDADCVIRSGKRF